MKINLPVTNEEYRLTDRDSIVSKTDLKGIITYINDDFIRISEFEEDELIGKPHNIVRHPDMPVEAFADVWASLKANRPWTGLVKNRRKNGGFYWVLANATPLYENGVCVGYMSVRSKPSAEQIAAATAAYALFRNGQAGSLRILDGKVVERSWLGKFKLFGKSSIKVRLFAVLAIMAAMLISVGVVGLLGLDRSNDSLHAVYRDRMVPMGKISAIRERLQHSRELLDVAMLTPVPEVIQKNVAEMEVELAGIDQLLDVLAVDGLAPGERLQVERLAADSNKLLHEGIRPAMTSLKTGDINLAEKLMLERIRPLYPQVENGLEKLLKHQIDGAEREYGNSQAQYDGIHRQVIAMIIMGMALVLMAIWLILGGVVRPIRRAADLLQKVAQGKYDNDITVDRQDETGRLMDTIKAMQITQGFRAADEGRIASENLRIRIGLDNVSTGVTIADTDRTIIYMNKSAAELMHAVEKDFRKVLPDFDAGKLKGSSIDVFHRNPEHQKSLLAGLNGTYRTRIEIGGRTFALAASPVVDKNGARLGTAMEWTDRTAEVAVEKEVADIVAASVQGDFTRRIGMQGKEGFFKQLCGGINQLMETSDRGLHELQRMLGSLARGDLTDRIETEYSGTFAQLKDDAHATCDQLRKIIGQIKEATDTINTASREIARGNMDLSHRTEEQSASLEETAASMEQLTSTVRLNAENARQASLLAHDASSVARKGGAVVSEVIDTMQVINEFSHKIAEIISVIDSIAFQTNILALNAAVEAAHAGEQGRGFAVVADEVRSLAQRSAVAAREIKVLVSNSVEKVEGGRKLVAQAGQTMDEIVSAVQHVTDIISEISAASAEQRQGIEQVSQAVTQMDEVTQQNAALVEQAAAAAESLDEEAQNLTRSVSVFKVNKSQPGLLGKRRTPEPARSDSAIGDRR